jgi:uncharacterized protein YbjT (DUF2867 family)
MFAANRAAARGEMSLRSDFRQTYARGMAPREVFVAGGTGYLGSRLIAALVARGDRVRALVRPGSEARVPAGCSLVIGNALDYRTYAANVPPARTFVHLVGTPHPSPLKARQFREVDLVSAREAVAAATGAGVQHFVYVSVAQPAPVMRAYIAARAEAEALIRASGLAATILRPWYVLGPGHAWPHALRPAYWLFEQFPATRNGARRLGLVTVAEMIAALVAAVATPPRGISIIDVPAIRAAASEAKLSADAAQP